MSAASKLQCTVPLVLSGECHACRQCPQPMPICRVTPPLQSMFIAGSPPDILFEVENFFRILPSSLSIRALSSSLPLQALISEMKFCNQMLTCSPQELLMVHLLSSSVQGVDEHILNLGIPPSGWLVGCAAQRSIRRKS